MLCALKKNPHYQVLLLQLPHLNPHDQTNLVPKVVSLATGPVHPSELGGSAKLSPSRQLLLQQRLWQLRHHLQNRAVGQKRRVPRVATVLNMSTERAVWGLKSWTEIVKVWTASVEQTCVTPKLKRWAGFITGIRYSFIWLRTLVFHCPNPQWMVMFLAFSTWWQSGWMTRSLEGTRSTKKCP